MSKSAALLLVVAGCYTGSTPTTTPPIANVAIAPPVAPAGIVISATSIGPVDANTPATLAGLRQKLLGFEVTASHADGFFHFDVTKDKEVAFYVVESNGKVFNVHTTSAKVSVANHPAWHVGATFADAKQLSQCDCWGEKIVCWKDGEHVAAAFDRGCSNMTGHDNVRSLAVLDGIPIQRMIWSPKPFGVPDPEEPVEPTRPGHGGGLGGTVMPRSGGGDPCGGSDPCDGD